MTYIVNILHHNRLSCREGTARRSISVEILSTAAECTKHLVPTGSRHSDNECTKRGIAFTSLSQN